VTIWDRAGAPLDPLTSELLFQAWDAAHAARLLLSDREPAAAARRAYQVMLGAAQALVWEEHRLRFRVRASYHAAFWDRFARPDVGLLDAGLHRWLLEAYALCGRDRELPAPRVTPEDAAHGYLGLRPPFAPPAPDPGGA
jgi:hypothetical protein